MHVETHVLSLDPTQKRNKIMSLWGSGKNPFSCPFFIFWAYICFGRTSSCNINFSVQMQMITNDMYGKTVQKAFDFLDAEYNMVIHVFLQKLVLSA